jgi:lipopolysaccharide transport system ATP-binding protein
MPAPVISVENLSKRYLVGHRAERTLDDRHPNFRDMVERSLRNAVRKAADVAHGRQVVQGDAVEEFWALKDVSFEVQEGEVLGIIGRNGAGKSTLLKILSRITEPSTGRITLRGRVASLLEVGTGFHPELSGRENVYLNGAILGMSRAEISRKFDEIVAFAEVEKFLDTPVKRYSSGMYVRLAFAVAAHLEPEILIVDEVLAVGDAEFQKKCLGKIDEVARGGRTVLFVSHNMAAIGELAHRAILLDKGLVATDGPVSETVSTYLSRGLKQRVYISPYEEQYDSPHIARAEVITSGLNGVQRLSQPLSISISVRHPRRLRRGHLGIQFINQLQTAVTTTHAYPPDCIFGQEPGMTLVQFWIPKLRLNIGNFHLRIWLTEAPPGEVYEIVDSCDFEVVADGLPIWSRPEGCAYHEEFSVRISEGGSGLESLKEPREVQMAPSG